MTRLSYFVIGLFLALIIRVEAKPVPMPPPPPMALPCNVSIYRGHQVDIPLKALGRAPSQLKFLIRTRPLHGSLGDIRILDEKNAVVTYTSDDKEAAITDSFTYAVQAADSPVSAAAQVSIIVSEEAPSLRFTPVLDFGPVLVGESQTQEVTLDNDGDGTLTGSLIVVKPWSISGSPVYHLGRHAEQKFQVTFAPTDELNYSGDLNFSHDLHLAMTLNGSGIMPFQFDPPGALELTENISGHSRAKRITVRNQTGAERTLKTTLPAHLLGPSQIIIAAHGETSVSLWVENGFGGSLEGNVVFSGEGVEYSSPVRAYALEPRLSVQPAEGFHFGNVMVGRRYQTTMRIRNDGGVAARPVVETPDEIELNPDPKTILLAPGASQIFELNFEPDTTGPWRDEMLIRTEDQPPLKTPLTATASPPASPVASPQDVVQLNPEPSLLPDNLSDTEKDLSSIPAIHDFRVLKTSDNEVEIGWPKPDQTTGYQVEWRELDLSSGTMKVIWKIWRNVDYSEANGLVVARFANLPAGRLWYIRVRSLDGSGKLSRASGIIGINTPPERKGFPWLTVIVLTGLAVYGFKLWRRRQQSERQAESERIARLGRA